MPVIVEGLQGGPAFGQMLGAWVKENTIAIAERALREEVAKGFDNQPVVITDGVPRRDYGDVKPFGRIEFARRGNMADSVLWALDALRKQSPVLTGRYVSSHTVLINGVEIQGDIRAALMNVQPTDRVQIVNPQPYARKLEGRAARSRGRGANRTRSRAVAGSSDQAKAGVYRVIVRALLQRYGRVMFFDFKYVKLNTGLKVWGYSGGGRRADTTAQTILGDYRRTRIKRDAIYPALQFYIKPDALPN
jgi:hypothetical protein